MSSWWTPEAGGRLECGAAERVHSATCAHAGAALAAGRRLPGVCRGPERLGLHHAPPAARGAQLSNGWGQPSALWRRCARGKHAAASDARAPCTALEPLDVLLLGGRRCGTSSAAAAGPWCSSPRGSTPSPCPALGAAGGHRREARRRRRRPLRARGVRCVQASSGRRAALSWCALAGPAIGVRLTCRMARMCRAQAAAQRGHSHGVHVPRRGAALRAAVSTLSDASSGTSSRTCCTEKRRLHSALRLAGAFCAWAQVRAPAAARATRWPGAPQVAVARRRRAGSGGVRDVGSAGERTGHRAAAPAPHRCARGEPRAAGDVGPHDAGSVAPTRACAGGRCACVAGAATPLGVASGGVNLHSLCNLLVGVQRGCPLAGLAAAMPAPALQLPGHQVRCHLSTKGGRTGDWWALRTTHPRFPALPHAGTAARRCAASAPRGRARRRCRRASAWRQCGLGGGGRGDKLRRRAGAAVFAFVADVADAGRGGRARGRAGAITVRAR